MAQTLLTIIAALVITVASLVFLRRDLAGSGQSSPLENFFPKMQQTQDQTASIEIGDNHFDIVVADTPEKREQGLSGTTSIPKQGMLFVFDEKDIHQFWMKDMSYDLDFIWIADGQVVDITLNVTHPLPDSSTSELEIYAPSEPVEMMLEVPSGTAESAKILIGDKVLYQP